MYFHSETELLAQWEQHRLQQFSLQHNLTQENSQTSFVVDLGRIGVYAPTSGVVHRVHCAPGDVIQDPDTTLVVLEAMKTEVAIVGGDEVVSRRVIKTVEIGKGVEGGDTIIILE